MDEQNHFIVLHVEGHFDRESGKWVAGSPELQVYSQGEAPEQAEAAAIEAISLFLEAAAGMGTLHEILEEAGMKVLTEAPRVETTAKIARWLAQRLRSPFNVETTLPLPESALVAC